MESKLKEALQELKVWILMIMERGWKYFATS